jgi:DNA-binding IscR family transcriptional regulator
MWILATISAVLMLAVIYSSSNPTQTQDDQKLTNFLEQVASRGIEKSRLLPKNNGKGGNAALTTAPSLITIGEDNSPSSKNQATPNSNNDPSNVEDLNDNAMNDLSRDIAEVVLQELEDTLELDAINRDITKQRHDEDVFLLWESSAGKETGVRCPLC